MASLRRALVRFRQTLIRTPVHPRPLANIRRSYLGSIHRFSSDHGPVELDLSNEESKRRLFNRLVYRSRQRGYLELDLVLGNWVEENIYSMDELRIRALEDVLDLENPDLWKWLTCQEQPPQAVKNNPVECLKKVFTAVQSRVMENLNNYSSPETRANPGQPWVRGWDDKRGLDGPKYGNQ